MEWQRTHDTLTLLIFTNVHFESSGTAFIMVWAWAWNYTPDHALHSLQANLQRKLLEPLSPS
eukprot:4587975-Amphidinium_carterae.1